MNDLMAPAIRWEPCEGFRRGPSEPESFCSVCGWLLDDHDHGIAAVVTALPQPRSPLAERRAS